MTENIKKEIVQRITRNLLDIQILRLLNAEPMWGYKIKKEVETKFGIRLRHGALYPLLNTMEQKGLIKSKKQQQGGRTRKVYTITEKGGEYIEAYDSILKEQIRKRIYNKTMKNDRESHNWKMQEKARRASFNSL